MQLPEHPPPMDGVPSPSTTGAIFGSHQLPLGRARSSPSTPEKRIHRSIQLTPLGV